MHRMQVGLYIRRVHQGKYDDSDTTLPLTLQPRSRHRSGSFCYSHILQHITQRSTLPSSYIRSLEHKVKQMEDLLRKILPPKADLKEELEAIQALPGHAPSMLSALVHSLSVEVPEVEDRDHALESNLEEFKDYILGYRYHGKSSSFQFIQEALDTKAGQSGTLYHVTNFTSLRAEFWDFRPWHNPHRYVPQGMDFKFPPGDLIPTLIDSYFMYFNTFLPILHRPTFDKSLKEGLHYKNYQFGGVVLIVCALGSKYVDDPRVLMEGEQSKWSNGWKWVAQVTSRRRAFPSLDPPNLYDTQSCCLLSEFYLSSSAPQQSWTIVGTTRNSPVKNTVEAELWKRAFWGLVCIDSVLSSALGRACAIYDEDIDVDLPAECDDEYWEHPDPQQAFRQPPGKPTNVSYLNCLLRLTRLIMICMRTIVRPPELLSQIFLAYRMQYSCHKSKVLFVLKKDWEQQIVVELDSALDKWVDSIPEHLRWDPDRADLLHFHQSASLLLLYYHLQMFIHLPFITAPSSGFDSPSLSICANAARSCSHITELQIQRKNSYFPFVSSVLSFNAAAVLLINIWGARRTGMGVDVDKEMEGVHKCMRVLADLEICYQYAGVLWDILYELASTGDLPLPNSRERDIVESFKLSENADQRPYADPQQSLFTLPINNTNLGRMPLHGQVDPSDHISDWYNANPYNWAAVPATVSQVDNVMRAIWDRAPSGVEPDCWRDHAEFSESHPTGREF
ncbi:fungal-specific transcription factor domain-containing protein [Desarmillaria tabescens]|uniref:Fungal-specific transcription factor domain-containing protein n=1 Tax=Armillaria tabescens TaxID=1929756 RepID=A0AA39TTN1_ARMTA|nr:fungal-specific transcription factor domain-containing protein [Desarmillaria tabescens]KAK0466093.1 fungal-specific transcription factor domain-containing protein [Desarmillaria tabescens]